MEIINPYMEYPFVTICTPTYNRRKFIPFLIECIKYQSYPSDKIEWVIIDDGTDKIEDLVIDIPFVKYYKYDSKMSIGKKRNLCNEKSTGLVIINFDDDDYYPPTRIMHAIKSLQQNPSYNIAGCNDLLIYFNTNKKIYKFGPYSKNHSTAASFAFNKCLLYGDNKLMYNEDDLMSEEKYFLKKYTIPLLHLNPKQTILSINHSHNTLNKELLLINYQNNPNIHVMHNDKLDDYITNPFMYNIITNILTPDNQPLINDDKYDRINNQYVLCNKNIEILYKNVSIIRDNQLLHQTLLNEIQDYREKYELLQNKYNMLNDNYNIIIDEINNIKGLLKS
jgi:glycosyltransferase involved in cell wall biosynthesis